MGQINLYRIDPNKKNELKIKLHQKYDNSIEERNCVSDSDTNYRVKIYLCESTERKCLEWQWVLDEFEYKIDTIGQSMPKALLVIEKQEELYCVSFGASYFLADSFCDTDFAFNFARRITFKNIKTTTLNAPDSHRNRVVNAYLDYESLDYDSGESYTKIKAKADLNNKELFSSELIEIGHSIKINLKKNEIKYVLNFIEYINKVLQQPEKQKIPIMCKVKDQIKKENLERRLLEAVKISAAMTLDISEINIIGVTEIFNGNDDSYVFKYKWQSESVDELTLDNIKMFMDKYNYSFENDFFNINVVLKRNGDKVSTSTVKKLLDYTDDEEKCILYRGEWYEYNDDYFQYLEESLKEIDVVYDEKYDYSEKQLQDYRENIFKEEKDKTDNSKVDNDKLRKKIADKYYAEAVYNEWLKSAYGFENYDKQTQETPQGRQEIMDLYKDETMYAVKIGNSSGKICYVADQSSTSLKTYKSTPKAERLKIQNVALWIVLKRKTNLPDDPDNPGKPDITKLKMLMLKNKIDSWKKQVRVMGFTPIIYINYWR